MSAIDELYEIEFFEREARREVYSDYYSSLRKVQNKKEDENNHNQESVPMR